jgi:hypothetical protein
MFWKNLLLPSSRQKRFLLIASHPKRIFHPEDGDRRLFQNVGTYLPDYTASDPRGF